MKKELANDLYTRFSKIYRDRTKSMRVTCMCWGLSCGDGWYHLLDRLSTELQAISDAAGFQVVADQVKEKFGTLRFYYHTEEGPLLRFKLKSRLWHQLRALAMRKRNPKWVWPLWYKCSQCLSRSGVRRLESGRWRRIRIQPYYDLVDAAIRHAEYASAETCEVCGLRGKLNDDGWLSTLCDTCRDARSKEKEWPRGGM